MPPAASRAEAKNNILMVTVVVDIMAGDVELYIIGAGDCDGWAGLIGFG